MKISPLETFLILFIFGLVAQLINAIQESAQLGKELDELPGKALNEG